MHYNSDIKRHSSTEGQILDESEIVKNWQILTQKYHWKEQIIQKDSSWDEQI